MHHKKHTSSACLAPFNSLFFSMTGKVYFCLANRKALLGTYPEQSVEELISGPITAELRRKFVKDRFVDGCEDCRRHLDNNTDSAAFINFHKGYLPQKDYMPRYIDFELDNRCNLNCVMCSPYFSSTVPYSDGSHSAYRTPYDDAFFNSFDRMAPQLQKIHFRGGEPFLIKRYHDFWSRLVKIKPSLRIGLTTNGTVLTPQHKQVLQGGSFDVNISLDTLQEDTYHKIRVGAQYAKYKENLDYLVDLYEQKTINLSACMCLMSYNWREFPALFRFCNEHDIVVYINYVEMPEYLSLKSRSRDEITHIIKVYQEEEFVWKGRAAVTNKIIFNTMLQQLLQWSLQAVESVTDSGMVLSNLIQYKSRFMKNLVLYIDKHPDFSSYNEAWFISHIEALATHAKVGFPIDLVYVALLDMKMEEVMGKLPTLGKDALNRKILDKYFLVVHSLEARENKVFTDNNF
jgi:molybdenum cofactor biosynthesis enzyme MoaA